MMGCDGDEDDDVADVGVADVDDGAYYDYDDAGGASGLDYDGEIE